MSIQIKTLTSLIPRLKEWGDAEPEYLYEINMEKFKQHPDLVHALVSTGTTTIYKATSDRRYGCGLPLSQAKFIDDKAPGSNLFGKILNKNVN